MAQWGGLELDCTILKVFSNLDDSISTFTAEGRERKSSKYPIERQDADTQEPASSKIVTTWGLTAGHTPQL